MELDLAAVPVGHSQAWSPTFYVDYCGLLWNGLGRKILARCFSKWITGNRNRGKHDFSAQCEVFRAGFLSRLSQYWWGKVWNWIWLTFLLPVIHGSKPITIVEYELLFNMDCSQMVLEENSLRGVFSKAILGIRNRGKHVFSAQREVFCAGFSSRSSHYWWGKVWNWIWLRFQLVIAKLEVPLFMWIIVGCSHTV